ncbi:MAG TPA: hypothetical protein VFO63_16335, partial [Blastocatellia bacterium]|nr:hypothetical protein [Blastocatellia bacterium]
MRINISNYTGIIRRPIRSLLAAAIMAVTLTALGPDAQATVVQTTHRIINAGQADFGSGNHSGGSPTGNATISFDWSTATGQLVSTGRV